MKRDFQQVCAVSLRLLCLICILVSAVSFAAPLDEKTKTVLESIIKGNEDNRSKITDMKMSATLEETISADEKVEVFNRVAIDYYQLKEKMRADTKHFQDSEVEDILKDHTSMWVYTGERTLSHLEGSTLCSVGYAIDKMKLATYLLEHDERTPSYSNFMEEIQFYLDRYEDAKDHLEAETIIRDRKKLIQVNYSTNRGGKG